ncbi:MAG: MarR family transcriptional regulator [Hyphomicrobiales bacterium]|nr:MarR family transcriptional regulator [Hyphomicrobiales bacterium]MDE2115000.1 MarR family transcriptional regulator [Hyphomicrobiales bacterium]
MPNKPSIEGRTKGVEALYEKPGHLVRRANQISMAIFAKECSELDLTSVQYAALTAICDCDGIDATRLSGLIALDRATIGGVMDRLETKGWVHRKPSQSDRRIKALHISASGKALLEAAGPKVDEVQKRLLAPLSPDEQQTFLQLLTKLVLLGNENSRAPQKELDAQPLKEDAA